MAARSLPLSDDPQATPESYALFSNRFLNDWTYLVNESSKFGPFARFRGSARARVFRAGEPHMNRPQIRRATRSSSKSGAKVKYIIISDAWP
jgi:hypothetical protein